MQIHHSQQLNPCNKVEITVKNTPLAFVCNILHLNFYEINIQILINLINFSGKNRNEIYISNIKTKRKTMDVHRRTLLYSYLAG